VGSSPTPRITTEPHAEKILNVLIHLKSLGRKETSLLPMSRRLRFLSRHVDLDNPQRVNEFISRASSSNNYKENMVLAYMHYAKFYKLVWQMPFYQREDREFKVPTSEDVNKIISHSKQKGALFYSIVRDVGMRPIEVAGMRVKDVDLENGEVYPRTAKGGSARKLKVKESTLAMLKRYVTIRKLGMNDLIFASESNNEPYKIAKLLEDNWIRLKNAVANKLQQPHLKTIRLYDLRHAFGTMTYHKTKDPVFTQRQMGHRSFTSTLRYIHNVNFDSEEFIVKVAKTVQEATQLLEQAYEYVTEMDGMKIFRKRK